MIKQEKYDLRNEFGVSYDEYRNDNLTHTLHYTYEASGERQLRNAILMTWLQAGELDPSHDFYTIFPRLRPRDDEPVLSEEMLLWGNWEAAF